MLGIPTGPQAAPTLPPIMSVGGIMPIMSLSQMQAEDARMKAIQDEPVQPVVQGLAAHVRTCWVDAQTAKNQVEKRMQMSLRQRRGEYEPDVLAKIRQASTSEIYMLLTAVKCRAAAAWLRDTLLGVRNEKPWTLAPTPEPTLDPQKIEELRQTAIAQLTQLFMTTGVIPPEGELRGMLEQMRDEFLAKQQDEARKKAERMESKMEDQLIEGGFQKAFSDFLDDLVTFPAAVLKGPVIRNKPKLQWIPGMSGAYTVDYQEQTVLEWERVSPFDIYPSPSSSGINDGYLIERHRLRRGDLEHLKGVEGYDDNAINLVLEEYGQGGLREWLVNDTARASAEGKSTTGVHTNPEALIDALQFWGSVQGKMLVEWGMDALEVPDPLKEYHVEVWVIGRHVIKATLNYHPLGLKPYYKACYEEIPGAFWGNSVPDLCRDTQNMCNGAARALSNNMGIASGPQVWVNVDRLPPGEDVTNIYPWKTWQVGSDPGGGGSDPIGFFQPSSNVDQLMGVYEKFAALADEYTGIPRYMTGDSPAGGAGRTASGMSMLMSNASKTIKQVVGTIDVHVLTPLLESLFVWNMKYATDMDLKGDVNVVARGAMSILLKEAAQVRRNEFLATTANPYDMAILGLEGRAAVLREVVETLDMPADKVVPSAEKLRMQQQMQAMLAAQPQDPNGGPAPSGQNLQDGSPQTDNFGPSRKPNP